MTDEYKKFLKAAARRRRDMLRYADNHGIRAAAQRYDVSTQRIGQLRKANGKRKAA